MRFASIFKSTQFVLISARVPLKRGGGRAYEKKKKKTRRLVADSLQILNRRKTIPKLNENYINV